MTVFCEKIAQILKRLKCSQIKESFELFFEYKATRHNENRTSELKSKFGVSKLDPKRSNSKVWATVKWAVFVRISNWILFRLWSTSISSSSRQIFHVSHSCMKEKDRLRRASVFDVSKTLWVGKERWKIIAKMCENVFGTNSLGPPRKASPNSNANNFGVTNSISKKWNSKLHVTLRQEGRLEEIVNRQISRQLKTRTE